MKSSMHIIAMFAHAGAQAFARGPLTFSLPALPTPRPGSVNVVQGGPSAGDAETDGHMQHSASKPAAVTDCCMWTAANGHTSKSSAMTAARLPAGQVGAHSDSADLFPWLKSLTVKQLLVCGLLSLRQQKAAASSSIELKHPHAGQLAFDLRYLPQWQTAVDRYARKELAKAESTAAPNPSAPEASDLSQEHQISHRKKQKLTHGEGKIPLLSAADEAACRCFAATTRHAMTAEYSSGGPHYTSSSKIYCILHRCSAAGCLAFVAAGITGAESRPNGDGSCSKCTNKGNVACKHVDMRCWACLD